MKTIKGYTKGVDLGGWLSQCDHSKETYDNYIGEEDIRRISEWGLDHVRVPVDYQLVEDTVEAQEGSMGVSYIEDGFGYISKAIGWCRKYNLNMILDLHSTFGFSFDDGVEDAPFFYEEKYQERFYRLWEEFAKRFGREGDMLMFELLNEVTDKKYCDSWNRIAQNCIGRIRKIAPDISIVVGGYYNNSIEAIPDLFMPEDDNIVYTFHCYEPLIFTHQGAYWIKRMDTSFRISIDEPYGVMKEKSEKYLDQVAVGFDDLNPDSRFDATYFDKYFTEAVRIAEERNVALYCGEYGVIDLASPTEILKWYKIIHNVFEKYGIGRAAWNYRGKDFGLVDAHMDEVRDEVIKVMVGDD